jgi:hypothetical protein
VEGSERYESPLILEAMAGSQTGTLNVSEAY